MRATQLVAVFVLAPLVAAATPAAVIDVRNVTVRIYDVRGPGQDDLTQALASAESSLASASIEVTWLLCPRRQSEPGCDAPLRPGDLVVRILPSAPPRDRRAMLPLGDAMVESTVGGVLATVYVDRVVRLASEAGALNQRALLGRVIAHELGHLLLASRLHSKYGLMRAVWTSDEVKRGNRYDWVFTPRDARSIHARRSAHQEPNAVWGTE